MKKTILFLAAAAFAACGGSSSDTVTSNATVAITSPASGSTVTLGNNAQKTVQVNFTVTGHTLMAPGQCGSQANCGHAHLRIDDAASPCNQSTGETAGDKYNVQITGGTTAFAQFAVCGSGAAGTHSITIELADDTHHLLVNPSGNPIASTVTGIVTH